MTDQEIINGLIAHDKQLTKEFFFVKCQPLFLSVMKYVFDYEVDYDEMVNELYLYLMADDAYKLRHFEYRSSLYQWLKVLSIRFFIKKRSRMIDNTSQEALYDEQVYVAPEKDMGARHDLERLLELMPTKRYVHVIRRLILENWEPERLAREMNISLANLYNIKRRAIAQLTRIALKDIKAYGR
jgi:DNA-directed RNA polymerase specialized sigma subunit, sigma24 homolog